jgi:hypothetical protein
MELLEPGVVQPHVVGGPAGAEFVAAGGEFADEVGQVPVEGVTAGFGAQQGDGGVRGAVPVGVEVVGAGSRKQNRAKFTGLLGLS